MYLLWSWSLPFCLVGGSQLLKCGIVCGGERCKKAFNAAASDLPCLLFLYQQCSACMEKGNWVFPSSLPSNQMLLLCFSFCFDEAILILFPSLWKRKKYAVSMHRSDDDDSTRAGWWTSGTLLVNWLGKPWWSSPSFSQADVGSPCLWPERLLPFAALQESSVCFLPM